MLNHRYFFHKYIVNLLTKQSRRALMVWISFNGCNKLALKSLALNKYAKDNSFMCLELKCTDKRKKSEYVIL